MSLERNIIFIFDPSEALNRYFELIKYSMGTHQRHDSVPLWRPRAVGDGSRSKEAERIDKVALPLSFKDDKRGDGDPRKGGHPAHSRGRIRSLASLCQMSGVQALSVAWINEKGRRLNTLSGPWSLLFKSYRWESFLASFFSVHPHHSSLQVWKLIFVASL